jgi:hypothetical protein
MERGIVRRSSSQALNGSSSKLNLKGIVLEANHFESAPVVFTGIAHNSTWFTKDPVHFRLRCPETDASQDKSGLWQTRVDGVPRSARGALEQGYHHDMVKSQSAAA